MKNTVHIDGGFARWQDSLSERVLDSDPWTIDPTTDSVLSGDRDGDDEIRAPQDCTSPNVWDADDKRCFDEYGLPKTRNSENARNVVTAPDGTNLVEAVLDGFTITAGFATFDCPNCGDSESGGGGIRLLGVTANGGATVRNCAVLYNRAQNGGGGVYGYGYLEGQFVDCVIAYNRADHGGGLVGGKGTGKLQVVNCQIVGNVAEDRGGGAYFDLVGTGADLEPTLVNTLIANNRAGPTPPTSSGAGKGGGIYAASNGLQAPGDVTLHLANCTAYGNQTLKISGTGEGGGLYLESDARAKIDNTIVWGNVADDGRQLRALVSAGNVQIEYSDVRRYNTGATDEKHVTGFGCPLTGTDCFVAGNLGHLAAHAPHFVAPPNNPADPREGTDGSFVLSLQGTSPCIDAGANPRVPQDIVDLDGDGVTMDEKIPLDLRRQARFVDGSPNDTGVEELSCYPSPLIVDMGAYEFVECDVVSEPRFDCNNNRELDACEIASGTGNRLQLQRGHGRMRGLW